MPAPLMVTVLAGLTAAVAALLLFLLGWRARGRAGSWHAGALDLAGRARRPLQWLMTSALLLAGAELLLPPERIETQVHHLQAISGGAVELSYVLCCTGGEVASCVLRDAADLHPGQAVELRRTRLLGRCQARAIEGPATPCQCS